MNSVISVSRRFRLATVPLAQEPRLDARRVAGVGARQRLRRPPVRRALSRSRQLRAGQGIYCQCGAGYLHDDCVASMQHPSFFIDDCEGDAAHDDFIYASSATVYDVTTLLVQTLIPVV